MQTRRHIREIAAHQIGRKFPIIRKLCRVESVVRVTRHIGVVTHRMAPEARHAVAAQQAIYALREDLRVGRIGPIGILHLRVAAAVAEFAYERAQIGACGEGECHVGAAIGQGADGRIDGIQACHIRTQRREPRHLVKELVRRLIDTQARGKRAGGNDRR